MKSLLAALASLALALMSASAVADAGAHGPGGEHLHEATPATAAARPRVEAKSELFELVGYLHDAELSVMINRFETNEPVLDANVEVASGKLKAVAKFHADHGDYAVDDGAFLKVLAAPGEHPLLFTVIAGKASDVLEGTLKVDARQAQAHSHGHSHTREYVLIGVVALAALIAVFVLWQRFSRSRRYAARGSLS